MNTFNENGYAVVRGALNKQTLKLLETNFSMVRDTAFYYEPLAADKVRTGDSLVKNSFCWYGAMCFESLMLIMQPVVQEITGKELLPCYSYARIMYAGTAMPKHKDRPACEYSTTICVAEDAKNPYPIFIENYNGDVAEMHLSPGDMLVYKGMELNHWRTTYKGDGHMQAFLHYVDANGDYKNEKFDKRPMLGLSSG